MQTHAGRALLLGGLTVGILDGLDAVIFFGLRSGATPIRIFQGIAGALIGRAEAINGGMRTALIGVAIHFFIAFVVVAVYFAVSRALPALRRRPFLYGPLYGVAVYAVMNQIVLPLAGAGGGAPPLPVLVNGILIHMFGVGLPSAWVSRDR